MKLTDIAIKAAKPKDKTYKLADGNSLYLWVTNTGSKYWRFKYRFANKEKLLALGVYPDVGLKEARERCIQAKKLLEQNIDPSVEKKKAKLDAYQESENTFEVLAKAWWENWQHGQTEKHANAIWNRLKRDVFPHIGNVPASQITPPMVLEIIKKAEDRGAYDVARRIKQTCGQIYRHGMATGMVTSDPTACLKDALRPYKTEHFPTLDIKEMPAFLKKLDDPNVPIYPQTRLAMKFMMLTFVRTSELVKATWQEIDLDDATWKIPAERMKMRRDHIVPLSTQAIDILHEMKKYDFKNTWVFPNQARPIAHMSNGTLTRAIMRMGYKGKMSGHGFRALAMTTVKEQLGYRHEVIDRQLAHAQNKINAAYDRALFLDERRKMMQDYADYLDQIGKKK